MHFIFNRIALLSFFFCSLAFADCDDDPNNLISSFNCSLDNDVSGWDFINFHDSITHDPSQDFLSQGAGHGSALVDAEGGGSFFSFQTSPACTSLSPTHDADKSGGVWLRLNSGSGVNCSINLIMYSDMICEASNEVGRCTTGLFNDVPINGNWSQLMCNSSDNGPLTSTPISLFTQVLCESTNDFTVNVDNLYIGQDGLLPVELLNYSIE